MIKGVNRQVLEIHDTGIDCFEKALFFVKPEYSTLSENKLRDRALQAFSGKTGIPKTKKATLKTVLYRILGLLSAAGTGAVITLLLN